MGRKGTQDIMAFLDSTPERLMPAPLAPSRDLACERPAAAPAPVAPEPVMPDAEGRKRTETIALTAIGLFFAGLVFTLAIKSIESLGIAVIVTLLTLLPIVSLGVVPSGKGR